jgi:hypothetical protein
MTLSYNVIKLGDALMLQTSLPFSSVKVESELHIFVQDLRYPRQ